MDDKSTETVAHQEQEKVTLSEVHRLGLENLALKRRILQDDANRLEEITKQTVELISSEMGIDLRSYKIDIPTGECTKA